MVNDYYTAIVTKAPSELSISKEVLQKLELEDIEIIKAINSLLHYVDDSEEVVLHQYVENIMKHALRFVENAKSVSKQAMKKIKELIPTDTLLKIQKEKDKASAKGV